MYNTQTFFRQKLNWLSSQPNFTLVIALDTLVVKFAITFSVAFLDFEFLYVLNWI